MLEYWPPQELQIGFPKFNGILFFQPWGLILGHKIQHLLVAWGQIGNFFSISALTPSVKALSADFNFWTNRNA